MSETVWGLVTWSRRLGWVLGVGWGCRVTRQPATMSEQQGPSGCP